MWVTSQEGLRVEKSRQPDNTGQRQVLSPAVQLFTALQHIIIPVAHTERKKIMSVFFTKKESACIPYNNCRWINLYAMYSITE